MLMRRGIRELVGFDQCLFLVVAVQLLIYVRFFLTARAAECQASLSFTTSQSLLKFMSIELVILSNRLCLCCPLLLLPSIFLFPSIRVFSNESALCSRWPKYWSFSISPLNEYSELVSFRIDWFDLLAVQGILKSLLQQHNSNASILWCSVFLMVQLSHHCRSVHHYWGNHSSDYLDLYGSL